MCKKYDIQPSDEDSCDRATPIIFEFNFSDRFFHHYVTMSGGYNLATSERESIDKDENLKSLFSIYRLKMRVYRKCC